MRMCLLMMVAAAGLSFGAETIEGKVTIHSGAAATLETADHRVVTLDGDAPTRKVLQDGRISGFEVRAAGHFTAAGKFLVDPQHKRALLVRHQDKLKMITYWCDVCGIRAYAPGPCVCCQKDTDLDLRDLDDIR